MTFLFVSTIAALISGVALVLEHVSVQAQNPAAEAGYESMFTTDISEQSKFCEPSGGAVLPDALIGGVFYLPSVAIFEMGGQNFTSVLDGMGKLNRFEFLDNGEVCFSSKLIMSAFYNESLLMGKIAPSVLFMDPYPKSNYKGMELLNGPNDNVYVNTMEIDDHYMSLTDSPYALEFSPEDLTILSRVVYNDTLDKNKISGGSAHVMQRRSNGCTIGIDPQESMMMGALPEILVYEQCPDSPFERKRINSYHNSFMPYFHSFGLTENYAILPHQPFHFDYMSLMTSKTCLVDTIVEHNDTTMTIKAIPLNGDKPIDFTFDTPFYYFHFINSFETENAIIFDVSALSFNMLYDFTLEMERSPEIRNSNQIALIVYRFTMYTSGIKKGKVERRALTSTTSTNDFPSYNKGFTSKEYCYFYSMQWFHDAETYASIAITKNDACSSSSSSSDSPTPVSFWYKEGYYPSEATFIPHVGAAAEDDGVLVFTASVGATRTSYLEIVDAKTMKNIAEIKMPNFVTFTTHGEFYPSK